MSRRIVTIIGLLSLIWSAQAYSQDCQECKTRRIILYDNEVTVQRPSANVDSIYRYWDYFFITGGVKSYLSNQDPTRDCITRLDGAFFTTKDTVTSSIKYGAEHANLPPPGEAAGFTDYILYGVVTSGQVTLKLETGKTRELVKSVSMALPTGFDPIVLGRTLGASLGPIYTTIMDFEIKKRDQGEPYAIQPKLKFTPAKTKINSNEKTTVEVLFLDCDGVALKNRNVNFGVTGGTTKPQSSVTTDDQGKASIEFTAGQVSTLATITATYPFQKPTGYMDAADVTPGYIQVNKPNDNWYMFGEIKVTNDFTNDYSDPNTVDHSVDHDETRLNFCAWLKNISLGIGGGGSNFIADPLNFELTYIGNQGEWSYDHKHSDFGNAGFIDGTSNLTRNAVTGNATVPKLVLNIGWDSYSFSVNNITANQNGGGNYTETKADPINGLQTTSGHTDVSPTVKMSLAVQGKSRDTTITINETTENPALGTKETKSTGIHQTVSWKNNTWTLDYNQSYDDVTRTDLLFTEEDRWHQTITARMNLTYTGDPPTGVEAEKQIVPAVFALSQNYPNPFNPTTTISYILPSTTRTSLMITDLLGRKVATLVDGEKPAGLHVMTWNASGLPSGVYFLQMRAGGFVETRKLLFAK